MKLTSGLSNRSQ